MVALDKPLISLTQFSIFTPPLQVRQEGLTWRRDVHEDGEALLLREEPRLSGAGSELGGGEGQVSDGKVYSESVSVFEV